MKITIDTKEDSKEEIRKAISMLSALVEGSAVYTNTGIEKQRSSNIFSDEPSSMSSPEPSSPAPSQNAFANMFGAMSSQAASEAPAPPAVEESSEEKPKKPEIQVIDY